jgi:hypothetical protein
MKRNSMCSSVILHIYTYLFQGSCTPFYANWMHSISFLGQRLLEHRIRDTHEYKYGQFL